MMTYNEANATVQNIKNGVFVGADARGLLKEIRSELLHKNSLGTAQFKASVDIVKSLPRRSEQRKNESSILTGLRDIRLALKSAVRELEFDLSVEKEMAKSEAAKVKFDALCVKRDKISAQIDKLATRYGFVE